MGILKRKKGLAEVLVQAVMSFYEGSRTKVKVGSGTSAKCGVRVGVHQGSVLSPLIIICCCGYCCDRICKRKITQ